MPRQVDRTNEEIILIHQRKEKALRPIGNRHFGPALRMRERHRQLEPLFVAVGGGRLGIE